VGQAEREASIELRGVAPLRAGHVTIGPVTLVSSGDQIIGFTSAELLRTNEAAGLSIATKLDGSATIPIKAWTMGRYTGIGLVELAKPLPTDSDVTAMSLGAICATVDTRGAPSALVTIHDNKRAVIPVYVDAVGGFEVVARLATPMADPPANILVDGSPIFAWFPAERALGRPAATLACAVGYFYRSQTFKPRERAAVTELVGLEDLGRAMSWKASERPDPKQVAGEFDEHELPKGAPD
jgi:hypothetical protein